MPGNVAYAIPNGVMPFALCTAFVEIRAFEQLQNVYHDGNLQQGLLAQASRRTFKLAQRLAPTALAALKTFWEAKNGGMTPFFFYNPFDVPNGQAIGSNYDPAGNATSGRVTVVFRGNWSQTSSMARTEVPQLELVEVA